MDIIQQDARPLVIDKERQATKQELLQRFATLRHAQAELSASGNGDLITCSLLELGQLSAALRFHFRVSDSELLYAVEVL